MATLALLAHRLATSWERFQVELHGKYPLRRIHGLHSYSRTSSALRVVLVCVLTPMPCIALVALEDLIPLNDPRMGVYDNYVFWLRDCLAVAFITIAILDQFRHCLPRLPMSNWQLLAITVIATVAGVGCQFMCATVVGFPLPFSTLFGQLLWTPAVILSCAFLWSQMIMRDRTLLRELLDYVMVLLCQTALTFIFPAYIYVFMSLRGYAQNAFVLVLPLIKILAKNWIARFLNDLDHLKPEVIIFNIDVFSALYVSCSLTTGSSTSTTILIMVVDALQMWISIYDIDRLHTKLRRILASVPVDTTTATASTTAADFNLLDVCAELLSDPQVCSHPHFTKPKPPRSTNSVEPEDLKARIESFKTEQLSTKTTTETAIIPEATTPLSVFRPNSRPSSGAAWKILPAAGLHSRYDTITLNDRVLFVDTAAKMLFLTEFILLVEFTEVMMPLIYTMYLVVMSRVRNRQFYPRLAAISEEELTQTITSVVIHGSLELLSFIVFASLIRQKLKISPLHQVAFVLDKQFANVQSKLILWMFYVVQTMLEHFGVDFSLRHCHEATSNTNSMSTATGSLLERRQSYDRIPRFFFPKTETNDEIPTKTRALCRQRALDRIDALLPSPVELQRFINAVCAYAYTPKLTPFQKSALKKTVVPSQIAVVDRLLRDNMVLPLSYEHWKTIASAAKSTKVRAMMTAQAFLLLPQDEDAQVNGYALLESVYTLYRTLTATRFLLQQPEGTVNGALTEGDLTAILQRGITAACASSPRLLDVDAEFLTYYELICTRQVVLRHDFTATASATAQGSSSSISIDDLVACPVFLEWLQLMDPQLHPLFVTETNRFYPTTVRNIHRQYVQLDRDKNGLLSVDEVVDFGKKKAFNPIQLTPTHDLTRVFVTHVFHETKTFAPQHEMDYKAYIDFTTMMADHTSLTSLRFFWTVLDFQKQGFLDAFTIDVFLRELVAKIHEHQREDGDEVTPDEPLTTTVARLRTQVFDLVGPRDPLRITWRDLTACKLGHLVVRLLTDYVAYRAYEACDGRFIMTPTV